MTKLVETWVTNQFEAPFKCTVKVAFMSGSDGEYDILALKTGMNTRIHDILLFIETKVGLGASLFVIANTVLSILSEASYVEVTQNSEDGITIYREPENPK